MFGVVTFAFFFVSLVVADNMQQQQGINGVNIHPSPFPGQQQFPIMSSMGPNSFGIPHMNPAAGGNGLVAQNIALHSGAAGQQQLPHIQNGMAPGFQPVDTTAGPEKVQKLEEASKSAIEAEKPLLQRAAELFRSKPRIQAFTSFAEEVEKSKLTQDQKQDLYKRVSSMTSI
uniref:SXP/RAL-2 family protein Ani s 5-like cation-binding domain-containing protein n=1 Tax=Panagrolaimus sp. ES5 TaxID=591445 RepID=A0AC34FMD1_9BILA